LNEPIRSGRDDGGDDKNYQDSVLEFLRHPFRRNEPHTGEEEDQCGKLENQSDSQDDSESHTGVFFDFKDSLKISPQSEEKAAGKGENDEVREAASGGKKDRREENKRDDIFLFFLVEAWSDELPELEENERRSGKYGRQKRDLDVNHKGLGQLRESECFSWREIRFNRFFQDFEDLFMEYPGRNHRQDDGDERVE